MEILGFATMLQVPVYTFFSEARNTATSKIAEIPTPGRGSIICPNFHLKPLYFKENHYDLVIPEKGQRINDLPL